MNLGLLAGLGAGLNSLAQDLRAKTKQDEEDARLEKKAELARKLQLDVLKAKQAYAEQHPEYKHFMKTDSGDIMAFDDSGHSQRFEGTEADRKLAADKVAGVNAYRDAQAATLLATQQPKIDAMGAQAEADRARANALRNPQPKGKPAPPANLKTPAQLAQIKAGLLKAAFGKDDPMPVDDAAYQAAKQATKPTPSQLADIKDYEAAAAKRAQVEQQMAWYKQMSPQDADRYSNPGLLAPTAPQAQPADPDGDPFADLVVDPNNPAGE